MAMTNAERQARWRDRMRDKMATAKFALEAADDGDPLHQIVRLKQDLAKEKERSKELREKLKARDAMERIDKNLADHHSTRAMYAEADKERLQAEVDRLTEENERLRSEQMTTCPLDNEEGAEVTSSDDDDFSYVPYSKRSLEERLSIDFDIGYRAVWINHGKDVPEMNEPLPELGHLEFMAMAENLGRKIGENRLQRALEREKKEARREQRRAA